MPRVLACRVADVEPGGRVALVRSQEELRAANREMQPRLPRAPLSCLSPASRLPSPTAAPRC